ncbi:hypothetical protein BIW11_01942, partial [Tropilaelaps mercedesae]
MARVPAPLASFRKLFGVTRCAVIGMIHVQALPGSPLNASSINDIVADAVEQAHIYRDSEVDGVLVENMNDVPYTLRESPEVTASMVRICQSVRETVGPTLPCGVQILAAQNRAACAVAAASNFNFIRVEGFVFGHIADEGEVNACAGELLRYRKSLGSFAENVAIFCDIKKKHSAHAITGDVSIADTARNADLFMADGLIVTGNATGLEPSESDIEEVASAVPQQPLILGSGVTSDNVR